MCPDSQERDTLRKTQSSGRVRACLCVCACDLLLEASRNSHGGNLPAERRRCQEEDSAWRPRGAAKGAGWEQGKLSWLLVQSPRRVGLTAPSLPISCAPDLWYGEIPSPGDPLQGRCRKGWFRHRQSYSLTVTADTAHCLHLALVLSPTSFFCSGAIRAQQPQ